MNSLDARHLDISSLSSFLIEAGASGYAVDAPHTPSTRPGSNDFEYESGDWLYHDTYFGARDFIGEEIVYYKKERVWGLNYYGFILDPSYHEDAVYEFLKEAMREDSRDLMPTRGPAHYAKGDWAYENEAEGDLARFHGEERILHKGAGGYRCWHHGGLIG